ncbi:hypothetical protein P4C99_21015 [Pontiellaceae bacterium B1224]|nr:hypothetical protein [Pontiellaceae bacterium B1224]
MKRKFCILGLLVVCSTALADIAIIGKKEMASQSTLIAIVDIQDLISTDKTKLHSDLIATGNISQVLKGNAKGEINFHIARSFPCATFDVSTGRHIVFLKKNEKNEYVGVNWYMSYLYLADKTVKWFDDEGNIVESFTPEQVVSATEALIKNNPNQGMDFTGKTPVD